MRSIWTLGIYKAMKAPHFIVWFVVYDALYSISKNHPTQINPNPNPTQIRLATKINKVFNWHKYMYNYNLL